MSWQDKLLPCPFCGGEAKTQEYTSHWSFTDPPRTKIISEGWNIYCSGDCDLAGGKVTINNRDDYQGQFHSQEAAIEAWNTRIPQPPSEPSQAGEGL